MPATSVSSAGSLAGKVALVSGGGSGIGLASARRFREEGASIVIADIDEGRGEEAAAQLDGRFVPVDVGRPEQWAGAVSVAVRSFGGLDVAFLNAGVTTPEADVCLLTDEQYTRAMRTNVDGVVYGTRAVVPELAGRGGGAIVVTASLAGLIAYSPDPIYSATKHAVVGLVRALAPQLGEKHITINAICPGLVDTPLLGADARRLAADAGFPLIPPTDIAEAVLGRVVGTETGRAWVCQVGREPLAYRFANVPGPRGEAAGRTPPAGLGADEEIRRVR